MALVPLRVALRAAWESMDEWNRIAEIGLKEAEEVKEKERFLGQKTPSE